MKFLSGGIQKLVEPIHDPQTDTMANKLFKEITQKVKFSFSLFPNKLSESNLKAKKI